MSQKAISSQSHGIRQPGAFYIGGEWVAPESGDHLDVVTPSTEEVFGRFAAANVQDINKAVGAARIAFDEGPWPRMTHAERAEYLRALSKELSSRVPDLSNIWTSEVGVTCRIADASVPRSAAVFDYYAGFAESFPFVEKHQPRSGGNHGYLVHEPVGVVGAIVAWNGSLGLTVWKCAPALLAGCTVVVKASPESPGPAWVIAEAAAAVGIPSGVFNVVLADREVSEHLVRHPDVDKITFTGSSAVGKRIASICGERIARCTLELGGKSAALILDDYDMEKAALSISQSARVLSGQICSSLTRLIVPRAHQDQLIEALSAAFLSTKVGDPFDSETDMGPLASARQRDRVESYIAKGRDEGARLVVGGKRPSQLNKGFYVEPTVFSDVDNAMTIARDEIFGPVLSVIPVDDDEQAIAVANDSPYGLNASVFTDDANRAWEIARRLRSGTVGHNSFRTDFYISAGGFKQSGLGREGGSEGLRGFLEPKTIILDAEPTRGREQANSTGALG
ncbi:aldehyde dehydrogenase [Brucella sp. 21LCYQ03]|nr:aldehyde dehydrogenase [Brucella sp. 21LCYQ03]